MAEETDPLKERLDTARGDLDRKYRAGQEPTLNDLVEIRDDLGFVYSHMRNQIIKLDRIKVTRNPNVTRAFWILLPTGAATAIGFIGYLFGQAGGG